jgi:L-threonylcarbamoyladenylate synthase
MRETQDLGVRTFPLTEETRQRAAEIIARGGVIAFRTDTFYGLGADPFNHQAVEKIKTLKGREERKPILIVVSDEDQIDRFIVDESNAFRRLARVFWPGPLTLIGTAHPALPDAVTAGSKSVGVRLPNDDKVRAMIRACGGALTATSANPSTLAPAATVKMVESYFGDQLDLIIDDGPAQTDLPSTVVDASGAEPKLVREGEIAWSAIQNLEPSE